MQEYKNNIQPELFTTDKEIEYSKQRDELVARMNDKLIKDTSLVIEKRTFFKDTEIAKRALILAMKNREK